MWPSRVVVNAPLVDDDLGLPKAVEDLAVQKSDLIPKGFLITHELQPALAGDTALEGFVPRPTRGAGSWRRDRISG